MSESVLTAHNRRLRQADPLLPEAAALAGPKAGDAQLECPDGVGVAALVECDPDSFGAIWSAARTHVLRAQAGTPAALANLLSQWDAHTAAQVNTGDDDAQLSITWPSRDNTAPPLFVRRGLAPWTVTAIRRAGQHTPAGDSSVDVRRMRPDELETATSLWMQLVAWDNGFMGHPARPTTEHGLRTDLENSVHDPQWTWMAVDDDEPVGLLKVYPPEQSDWVQPLSRILPAAYLGVLFVAPGRRSSGVGAAMVAEAHAELDAAGIPATLLHYAGLNPLSGPFWHRCGYRPLWTKWARMP